MPYPEQPAESTSFAATVMLTLMNVRHPGDDKHECNNQHHHSYQHIWQCHGRELVGAIVTVASKNQHPSQRRPYNPSQAVERLREGEPLLRGVPWSKHTRVRIRRSLQEGESAGNYKEA